HNNNNTTNNTNNNHGWIGPWSRSAVGGISIDADRIVRSASQQELSAVSSQLLSSLEAIPSDLSSASSERKISLRRLSELVANCEANGETIPDAARFLGGMTSIEYVVADPEQQDLYLVGSAEPWTVDESGLVVGTESGKPVLQLEDLAVALRSAASDKKELISCSIDPTQEAIVRLAARDAIDSEELNVEAMGNMTVTLTGVPATSRMASALVAADYRMKRVSLGFDEASIKNFPSYFGLVKRAASSYGQRFWMEPKYNALYRDENALVWKVSESSVEVLTEREYFSANGTRTASEKNDPAATKFASNMTKRFAELAKAEPVFADAKNCMDAALVAALIYGQKLEEKSGCDLSGLLNVATPEYVAPAAVQSDSIVRKSAKSVASVTGGILINPWKTIADNQVDASLSEYVVKFESDSFYAD
ncbi:MAG: DUF1598 domain-containing protein, partial [Thermoguttaceae bacterium]|nr:DUF1598 domain-containing protein [Thermoguttaceae bacterium]